MSINWKQQRLDVFNRRVFVLVGGQLVLFSLLAGRLFQLQVTQGARYQTLAEDNRIHLRVNPPVRGRLLDRNGQELAHNAQNFRLLLLPEEIDDLDELVEQIGRLIPLDPVQTERAKKLAKRRDAPPIALRQQLSWEEVSQIELHAYAMSGAEIEEGQNRSYPLAQAAAHVTGYIGPLSEAEAKANKEAAKQDPQRQTHPQNDPALLLPDFTIGKAGVEKQNELWLRGRSGFRHVEVDAHGRAVREIANYPPTNGQDLSLHLDGQLQSFIYERLGGESGSVVVMDANTGAVYALVTAPAYNPNSFTDGIPINLWRSLNNDPLNPLINKAIAGEYAPGSTMKMLTALAALEHRVITPSDHIFCSGQYRLGNAAFHCWKKGGHGSVDLHRALVQSCDVYFYEVSRRMGIDRLASVASQFGLGQLTNIDLPGERKAVMPTRAWKRKQFKAGWSAGESIIAGIGQGMVLTTPLQLAVMMAGVINGGKKITPKMVQRDDANAQTPRMIDAKPDHLALVKQALDDVTNDPSGTAYRARITAGDDGNLWAMGGKTGTSQVRRITAREREQGVKKNEDLPWKKRDHALFVGYAPLENPRLVISVVIEHGGSGGHTAAPIARDIMVAAQQLLKLSDSDK
jgi:penicillin-binding protein 2